MENWSPTEIMSNLATSLASSLRRAPRQESRDQLIRSALLADDDPEETESNSTSVLTSRSGSPEIPKLDSPSVFTVASKSDENCDPNSIGGHKKIRKSRLSLKNKNCEGVLSPKGILVQQ